jgi:hypothetical protein
VYVAKFQFFLGEPEISFFGELENLDTYIAKFLWRACMKPDNLENLKSVSVAADTVFDGFQVLYIRVT